MTEPQPPGPLDRIHSLLHTGPSSVAMRLYDQAVRKATGHPVWGLSRITDQIYVGGQHYPRGWPTMLHAGITAVLNMREAHYDDVARGIGGDAHLHLATRDNTPPTLADLHRAAEFIAQQVVEGGRVYVHCGVGVGRAPVAAAAYFIREGLSAAEAMALIREKRPFVHPTRGQYEQLVRYQDSVRSDSQPAPHTQP